MLDLTNLVEAVIALVSAAITAFLIPWLKTKYGTETLNKARGWVEIAVYAAEKLYGAGNGDQKLAYVETVLAEHKIKLDTKTLKAMVDSEIKKMEMSEPPKLIEYAEAGALENDPEPPEEEEEEEETPEPAGVGKDGV